MLAACIILPGSRGWRGQTSRHRDLGRQVGEAHFWTLDCCGVEAESEGVKIAGKRRSRSETAPETRSSQGRSRSTGDVPKSAPTPTRSEKTTRLSVRNVVPTLTSNKRQGLSLNGRCQEIRDRVLSWFRPRGRTSSSGVLGALYCSAPGCL
jgi:hypothetical protein